MQGRLLLTATYRLCRTSYVLEGKAPSVRCARRKLNFRSRLGWLGFLCKAKGCRLLLIKIYTRHGAPVVS